MDMKRAGELPARSKPRFPGDTRVGEVKKWIQDLGAFRPSIGFLNPGRLEQF
jgi:hypothetical protein